MQLDTISIIKHFAFAKTDKAYHKMISVFDFSTYATYITNITRTFFFVKARKQEIT
jgi:hypothetical protein